MRFVPRTTPVISARGGSTSLRAALGVGPAGPQGEQGEVGPSGGPIPAGGSPGDVPTPTAGGGYEWLDLSASYVGRWQPLTTYTLGVSASAPDGSIIVRNATGTSRATFDSTEEAAWTVQIAKAGTLAQVALQTAVDDAIADSPTVTAAVNAAAPSAVSDAIYMPRTTKNLYNPADADVTAGKVVDTNGTLATSASYTSTGYIPVTAGEQYTMSNPRAVAFYDASKVFISGSYLSNGTNATLTRTAPVGAAYMRTSFLTSSYSSSFQVEHGAVATAYEAYYSGTRNIVDPDFATSVATAINALPPSGTLTVALTGTAGTISDGVGGKVLAQAFDLAGSANGAFNLTGLSYDNVLVSAEGDEITPIRCNMGGTRTLGAGHGYDNVRSFTNPDGKDTTDLGAKYTDGTYEYAILAFDATNKPILGRQYTTAGGVTQIATVAPAADLTWVSGGTHHGTIDHTTISGAIQLYPSVGRVVVTLWVDGVQITANGSYKGRSVEVRESYEILDYADLYDKATANVGTSYTALGVKGMVAVVNRFRWSPGGRCRITTTYTELTPTQLSQSGAVQAIVMTKSGYTLTRYVPGVGTISGFDWTAGVDMTSYSTDVLVTTSDLLATGRVPSFAMDVLSSGGTPYLGFAMGYLPDGARGDEASRNARRLTNSASILFDLRGTKKLYPTFTTSEAPGWGTLKVDAFRSYLSPAQCSSVIAAKSTAPTAWAALDGAAGLAA